MLFNNFTNSNNKPTYKRKMTYPINPTAVIIKEFIKELREKIEWITECFTEEHMEMFEETDRSIIGLLQLSDGELNDMFSFKTEKFCYEKNTPSPCGRYNSRCYIGYKHRDIDWESGITDSDEKLYNIEW